MGNNIVESKFPLVSVIMPAYNARKYVAQAIRSVANQTIQEWELLVLDDCSADDTCAIVEELAIKDERIALIRNEKNIGAAKTRNRGLELARGHYIAFLDSDDIWHPEKLEKQLACMKETGADLCYSSYAIIGENNEKALDDYLVPNQICYKDILKENVIGCSTVVLSAEIAEKYRFNTNFYHEDYVLWLQILKDGYTATGCSNVLVDWRRVENSRSFNKIKSAKNRWHIYRKFLRLSAVESAGLIAAYALAGLRKYRKNT